MRLLFKITFKNIIRKPFRSFMVIASIFICAVVAIFCFDLGLTEADFLDNLLRHVTGTADLTVGVTDVEGFVLPEGFPEHKTTTMKFLKENVYLPIEGEYAFVSVRELSICTTDFKKAKDMQLMGDLVLKDDETIITDTVAKTLNLDVGDILTVHDKDGNGHDLKIIRVAQSNEKNVIFREYSCVVTPDAFNAIAKDPVNSGMILIDLDDDSLTEEWREKIADLYPNSTILSNVITKDTEVYLRELMGVLALLFIVTFLLVIFVTVSTCERIVSDRMSFIGTLRSLGMRSSRTALFLLLENIIYALCGAVPGVILYFILRTRALSLIYSADVHYTPELAPALPFIVVIGAVIIECIIPLKFIIKALKTSIRDIIFDNRDTEYKFSKVGITIGLILFAISVVTAFIKEIFVTSVCVLCAVVSLALLYPLILKGVSHLIVKISRRAESEKWMFAGRETIARKSTVGSGILCVTTAALSVLIVVLAVGTMSEFDPDILNCDVIVDPADKKERFAFIEHLDGIEEIEYVYDSYATIIYEDDEESMDYMVFGIPEEGYKLYNALEGVPDGMHEGQICVEKTWADERGVKIGDTIKLTFEPDGVFPIEKELEVVSFFKVDKLESLNNNIAVSMADLKSVYHEPLDYILINSSDPSKTAKDIRKYGASIINEAQTKEERLEEMERSTSMFIKILVAVVAVALVTPCMGLISNQLIGFEGRKKECAVLISTSMRKKTLAGIFFREMFIASVTACTTGAVTSAALYFVIKTTLDHSDMLAMDLHFYPLVLIIMWVVVSLIFALTVLFPIRQIKKMKLSEQLKYE